MATGFDFGGPSKQSQSTSSSFNRSSGSSQQSASARSGVRLNPQQQAEWDFQLGEDGDLRQRLAGTNPSNAFANRMQQFGGAPEFTRFPIEGVLSPEQIGKQINTYFSDAQRLTDQQTMGQGGVAQNQSGKGFGVSQADLNRQERNDAIFQRNKIAANQQATQFDLGSAQMNAAQEHQQRLGNLQLELGQANELLQRFGLATAGEGQFIQRENALYNQLARYTNPWASSESQSQGSSRQSSVGGSFSQATSETA